MHQMQFYNWFISKFNELNVRKLTNSHEHINKQKILWCLAFQSHTKLVIKWIFPFGQNLTPLQIQQALWFYVDIEKALFDDFANFIMY